MPSELNFCLSDKTPLAGNVTNLGAAMNTSREGVTRSKTAPVNADLLLLSFGLVDAWITSIPSLYVSYYPDNPLKRQSRKLLKSLKKKLRGKFLRSIVPVGPVVHEAEFSKNVTNIIDTLRSANPKLQILIWGAAPTEDEDRNALLIKYDEILKGIAENYDGLFLDTKRIITPYPRTDMFDDPVHLSEKACRLVANAMLPLAEELLKKER